MLNLNQANKQSVLDPSNLDTRALSALAQTNHETSSNGGNLMNNLGGGVETNVSSAVNSLAYVGDGSDASQKQSTTPTALTPHHQLHQFSSQQQQERDSATHASQRDY